MPSIERELNALRARVRQSLRGLGDTGSNTSPWPPSISEVYQYFDDRVEEVDISIPSRPTSSNQGDIDPSSIHYRPVYAWGKKSRREILTLDVRLVYLANRLADVFNVSLIKGHRGKEEQNAAFNSGHSRARWGESKHNFKVSLAMDIVPYPTLWDDIPALDMMLGAAQVIARDGGFNITLGKYFSNLPDYAHIEIDE